MRSATLSAGRMKWAKPAVHSSFVNGIQPLALGTDWRQFANVCAWLGACRSLCPGSVGGLIGKPERVIPDRQSFQAVTWWATFQTISNMNIQGLIYSSSRHWEWLIPQANFQALLPERSSRDWMRALALPFKEITCETEKDDIRNVISMIDWYQKIS